jgi:endonuclease/exonuclease/phosphatase family metal-dependent hydrolase
VEVAMSRMQWGVGVVAVAGSLVGACGGSEQDPSSVRLATFNSGLAPLDVDHVEERRAPVVAELAELAKQLDVLCVQEFWMADDWQALVDATESELPHALRMPPRPGDEPKCLPSEAGPLLACAKEHCAGEKGLQLQGCVEQPCAAELAVAMGSGSCTQCLIDQVLPGGGIDEIASQCIADVSAATDVAIFGGAFDTGLLTREKPIVTEARELTSYFVRANVLYAKLEREEGEPLNVFCTHLGSEMAYLEHDWKSEQQTQIAELLAFIDDKAPSGPIVLLGDLNTGPETDSLSGEWPDHYALLESDGFACAAPAPATCTYCPENTFRDADATSARQIDHILVKEIEVLEHRRLFTEPVTLGELTTHLSDHYGLAARVR